MSSTVFGVSFDAHDALTVASFWARVLGRTVAGGGDAMNASIDADPAIPGSRIGFHRVPEGKAVKNRLHFDRPAVGRGRPPLQCWPRLPIGIPAAHRRE